MSSSDDSSYEDAIEDIRVEELPLSGMSTLKEKSSIIELMEDNVNPEVPHEQYSNNVNINGTASSNDMSDFKISGTQLYDNINKINSKLNVQDGSIDKESSTHVSLPSLTDKFSDTYMSSHISGGGETSFNHLSVGNGFNNFDSSCVKNTVDVSPSSKQNTSLHKSVPNENIEFRNIKSGEDITNNSSPCMESVSSEHGGNVDATSDRVPDDKELEKGRKPSDRLDQELLKEAAKEILEANLDITIDVDNKRSTEEKLSEVDLEDLKEKALGIKNDGNVNFKQLDYVSAVKSYTSALRILPLKFSKERSMVYSNRAAALHKLNLRHAALDDSCRAVELDETYLKPKLRRAVLFESLNKLDESLKDYQDVLKLDSSNRDARMACMRLPPLIEERNEKMKTEMMGKLKDLGNMFLRPFGMSTDNFNMVKDPNSGGYSISFNQGK